MPVAGVVRVVGSFLLAAFASVGAVTLLAFLAVYDFGPLDRMDLSFPSAVLLLGVLPATVVGGLIWLPVLLAVRKLSSSARFWAITFSPLAGAAYFVLLAVSWELLGGDPMPSDIFAFVMYGVFTLPFSFFFLAIDRRWGDGPLESGGSVVMLSAALLAAALLLCILALANQIWR